MDPRVILHADMDAFYASVEQRDRPELRGRPVIVGGTSKRGVVCAASYEARVFGVRSAMPTAHAHKLCPDGVFLHGDMAKYRRVSAVVRKCFVEVSPEVEPLSLDEAFIDATGSVRLLGAPLEIGRRLRARVREETGLAVSVGIAPAKLVAKIASDLSKPDGLLQVTPDEVSAFLEPLPVWRLWGVGPVTQAALARVGIATIGDLRRMPDPTLAKHVGERAAGALAALAGGDDTRVVDADREAKSYGEENTFGTDVRDDATVRSAIIAHAEAVARRLRHDGLHARTVVLKMKLARPLGGGRFPLLTRQAPLPSPSDDGHALAAIALALWERHRPREAVRLIGVSATGICGDGAGPQLGLFDAVARPDRRTRLNRALDRIVARFGADAIARGGAAPEKAAPTMQWKRGER